MTSRPRFHSDHLLLRLAPLVWLAATVIALWGTSEIGHGLAQQRGWLCSLTDSETTIVTLPTEPVPIDDYRRMVTKDNGCVRTKLELTITGLSEPDTALAPIGELLTVASGEPIVVRVEATLRDFLSECGDYTGRSAPNFPNFRLSRPRCDPTIETRCVGSEEPGALVDTATMVLVRCPEWGTDGQRCLAPDGHISMKCDVNPETCLDPAGRFYACPDEG